MMGLLRRLGSRAGSAALGGPAIQVGPRHLGVEGGVCQTLIATGYPRDVAAGWAEPLLCYPGRVDAALHIEPVPAPVAAHQLRRRRARLESAWRSDAARGRIEDPHATAAASDAAELAERIATGQAKLFKLAVYITVHAADAETLHAEVEHIQALAASMLVDLVPATFRALQGWISTLPLATDALAVARTMDTDAIAAAMPVASPELTAELGETTVVYGANSHSHGLVLWDRFCGALDNHNSVILARSGAGKSYLAKLEILRSLMTGIQIAVIDPEDEYARLAEAVGGTRIPLGTPEGTINPFDLPGGDDHALTNRCLFAQTLITAMCGALSAQEAAALDRGVLAAYAAEGITRDPQTWHQPPPLMAGLAAALEAEEDPAAASVAGKLTRYVSGSANNLFQGPTTAPLDGHLTVVSLRQLPAELKTVGMLLILDALWRQVLTPTPAQRRPRMICVDEGWQLLQDDTAAQYLFQLAKRARKHWAGLTLITQDVDDVLGSELGRAVVANASTQILLRQAPQHLDAVAEAFHLSAGERAMVGSAARGDALLVSGHQRVGLRALASPEEEQLITTSPEALARVAAEEANAEEADSGEEA